METTVYNAAVSTVRFPLQALLVHLTRLVMNTMEATQVNDFLYAAVVQTLCFALHVFSSSDGIFRGRRSKELTCTDSAMVLFICFFFLC